MPEYEFFNYILSPIFLITFGLTLATFLPIAYSLLVTWLDNDYKVKNLQKLEREKRRRRFEERRNRARS